MGWTDLFKSKNKRSEAASPDGRVRWFGKLPTYADYYSSPTDQDWAAEFNEWVLKGYEIFYTHVNRPESAGAGRPRIDRRMPQSECILRLPKSGMTVFAAVMDYGGDMRGRPFPMFFYVGMPSAVWPGPTSGQAAATLEVLNGLSSLRTVVGRFLNSPGHFETVFGGREIDVETILAATQDDAWLAEARQLEFERWCGEAGGAAGAVSPARWLQGIGQWGGAILGQNGQSFEPTLQFPLGGGISTNAQVAGWLHWLGPRLRLAERRVGLALVRDAEDRPVRLALIGRSAAPEDFLLLTPLWSTLPYVDDLGTAVKKQDSPDPSVAPVPQGLSWANVMLGDGAA